MLKKIMLKKKLSFAVAFVLLWSQSAFAADLILPGAGGQIQQIPPAPMQRRATPEIQVEQGRAQLIPDSDKVKILVNSLHVTGQTLYSESELLAATGFVPGSELTLFELRTMASMIADHYHADGYFVAQAYLPPQEIKDNSVTIAVLEGQYGSVTLNNQTNLSDRLANSLLDAPEQGTVIAIAPLENRLLLLSDVPGVKVKSTLTPGAAVGTSDLNVDLTPGRRVTGNIEADNAGYYYTGRYRIGGSVNLNNPLGLGDVLGVRALTSGSGMTYGRAFYQLQLGKATAGVAYAAMDYEMGEEFEYLDLHGTAQIASIYGNYPLIRSRTTNLYALAEYDYKIFRDKMGSTLLSDTDVQVGMVGLAGNHRDRFAGGGLTTYSLIASIGDVDINTPEARAVDDVTAQTNGSFQKLRYSVARLHNVTDRIGIYAGINGQFASQNLDVSEKMSLGGPYAVRAYPVGEGYSDEAYVATLEGRLLLPTIWQSMPGQMHLIGFADTGTGTINKDPWTAEDNHRTLSGAGIGLTWADYDNFSLSVSYAHRLGNEAATAAPDDSGQFWFQIVKYF
ncbi:ShlB/FhaC/HecB family hemolysin secretion/activation protein [Desulfotignum phosphitoxidans]|uniref:Heme/hemopexin outer membrane transporter protein huxB n=1 Tax=Desulfotignum phosphitoxidans DSM 13687 TaxID=1286635 RepID=S0G2N3_9BACT|nr:ShlB/FhaC/HecB family hemolysin secretion/activation protein [Desulfotignum phosphitoxidans]EMS81613.1 heme/hemopexin outer membrane transporter protein huxB [Desulfotignum phosphitoxidans DSM 13687]